MIIAFRQRFSYDLIFQVGKWIVVFTALCIVAVFLREVEIDEVDFGPPEPVSFSYEGILEGPLALKDNRRSPLALVLEEKLALLARAGRPDLCGQQVFRIGIKGEEKPFFVKEGEQVFLDVQLSENGRIDEISFSEEETKLAMTAHALDRDAILLKFVGEEEMELVIPGRGEEHSVSNGGAGIFSLAGSTWWGADQFFREYGGEVFKKKGMKEKVEVRDGERSYVLFIGSGDFLSFREGKWVALGSLAEAVPDMPLAKVTHISGGTMHIEAWNEEGFSLFFAKRTMERAAPLRIAPDKLFSSLKQRSAHAVSCQMEKKRLVLREGDWLLKTKTGWHKVRSRNEIEGLLSCSLRGDLFVVDKITSGTLKGTYFDEMRTQKQLISASVAKEKVVKKSKKRSILSKR